MATRYRTAQDWPQPTCLRGVQYLLPGGPGTRGDVQIAGVQIEDLVQTRQVKRNCPIRLWSVTCGVREAATARRDHKTERRRSLDDRHNFRRIARSHDQGDAS